MTTELHFSGLFDSPREAVRTFLPGPVHVLDEVRDAMTAQVMGHRSAAFKAHYAPIARALPEIFRTAREVYLATGSSTLVMESVVISTVERSVLNLSCGSFSERWHTICRSLGKEADELAVPWGEAVDLDALRDALRKKRYEAVTFAHNETSTGVLNPAAEIARVIREESDALVLMDAVSSLGGAPVETDAWGLDVVLTGSQKCLAAPPGLAMFTMSQRAEAKAERVPHRGYYTDVLRYRDNHRNEGTAITTPAVSIVFALESQVEIILREGMENRWQRHAALRKRTEEWAEQRGLEYASSPLAPSPTVSCFKAARQMPAPELVRRLAERGIVVGGGYGAWKPSTFRIGHMGEVRMEDLEALLAEIDEILASAP